MKSVINNDQLLFKLKSRGLWEMPNGKKVSGLLVAVLDINNEIQHISCNTCMLEGFLGKIKNEILVTK